MLLVAISRGTAETDIWPENVLSKQVTVDVPLRVKKIPLVLFKNWLFIIEMEVSPEKTASIAKVVVFSIVHEETSKL